MGAGPESRWCLVGGVRWHALSAGEEDAPPVILVHGLGVSGRYMQPLLERLAGSFRVLAPDLPGFGRSSDPAEPLDLPALAEALVGWMEAEGIEAAAMVGNSLGCQVIARVAERHPASLARAILISPTMDPGAPLARQQIARLLADVPRERWPLQPIAIRDYLEAGVVRGLVTLRAALEEPAGRYRQIDVPTLVVRGGRDPIVSVAWAAQVARLVGGRLVTVPGAPHAVHFSALDALAQIAVPFLGGSGSGEGAGPGD